MCCQAGTCCWQRSAATAGFDPPLLFHLPEPPYPPESFLCYTHSENDFRSRGVAGIAPLGVLPEHVLVPVVPPAVGADRLGLDVPGGATVFGALSQVAGNLVYPVRSARERRGVQSCRAASWHQHEPRSVLHAGPCHAASQPACNPRTCVALLHEHDEPGKLHLRPHRLLLSALLQQRRKAGVRVGF